jgi:hypothetical protein
LLLSVWAYGVYMIKSGNKAKVSHFPICTYKTLSR